jgi:hypothetical protein
VFAYYLAAELWPTGENEPARRLLFLKAAAFTFGILHTCMQSWVGSHFQTKSIELYEVAGLDLWPPFIKCRTAPLNHLTGAYFKHKLLLKSS